MISIRNRGGNMGEANARLYNVETAAQILSVFPHTLRKWGREGRVAVTRLGRTIRFSPAALEHFVESNTHDTGADGVS
jgi:excisionase family DNA binding protein